jgi:hypothetical protein
MPYSEFVAGEVLFTTPKKNPKPPKEQGKTELGVINKITSLHNTGPVLLPKENIQFS